MDVLTLEGYSASDAAEIAEVLPRLAVALDINRRAFLEYLPSACEVAVDYLRATDPFPDAGARFPDKHELPDRGWTAFVSEVIVHDVPGNHFSLLARAHVERLAGVIRDVTAARLSFCDL